MMNQRIVIYIILSAILLYLYYKKRDIAVFAAFIVVVGATLIFGDRTAEGFGGGGGDKVDSQCAKLGFTAPKLDKDDLEGSLEKAMKNIKKVADKHWPYDDRNGKTDDEKKKGTYNDILGAASDAVKMFDSKEETDIGMFGNVTAKIYDGKIKANDIIADPKMTASAMSGGKLLLKILDKVGDSRSVMDKPTADDAKKLLVYLRCLCKHWISICSKLNSIAGGKDSGDDDDGDKKKKTSKTKKDDEDGGDEEEKPKKKSKKKAKKDEDAGDDE
jgi:hypothetical protein